MNNATFPVGSREWLTKHIDAIFKTMEKAKNFSGNNLQASPPPTRANARKTSNSPYEQTAILEQTAKSQPEGNGITQFFFTVTCRAIVG